MVSEGTEAGNEEQLVGRTLRLFSQETYPEEERDDNKHMEEIDP